MTDMHKQTHTYTESGVVCHPVPLKMWVGVSADYVGAHIFRSFMN